MTRKILSKFVKNQRGAALIEFAFVIPFLLLTTFTIVEGGYIFYQANGTQKATQLGARVAATRPAVAIDMDDCVTENGTDTDGLNAGVDCSTLTNFGKIECAYDPIDAAKCDATNFKRIRDTMVNAYPFIEDDSIFITYEGTGLGYVGRGKPVPAITVELRNVQYEYIAIGHLLNYWNVDLGTSFKINNIQTTVIGEDIGDGA